jgi:hypothetical protein
MTWTLLDSAPKYWITPDDHLTIIRPDLGQPRTKFENVRRTFATNPLLMGPPIRGLPVFAAAIDIGLFNPTPQCVPAAPDLWCNCHDRCRLIGILVFMFKNHPNRAGADLSRKSVCSVTFFHRLHPYLLWSLRQTWGGSIRSISPSQLTAVIARPLTTQNSRGKCRLPRTSCMTIVKFRVLWQSERSIRYTTPEGLALARRNRRQRLAQCNFL